MEEQKKALITGITGQDGSYLSEFLLDKGYEVSGIVRRSSTENYDRISHIKDKLKLLQGDLTDQNSLVRAIKDSNPDEIYNLGAQSFVKTSWDQPELTSNVTGLGVTRMLDAIRETNPKIKFYQASSSEMFGNVQEAPQTEKTPFHPRSPYGVSKLYGHWMTVNYRDSYDMFACSGILFNHESPRRGLEFVTRKITNAVAKIKFGLQNELLLGNLDSKRDWGFAGDYVEAMWLMMQQNKPDIYVIGTGETYSVRDFLNVAFDYVGLDYQKYVKTDPKFLRPAEVPLLLADPSKAKEKLGWEPKMTFEGLIRKMVDYDLDIVGKQSG